MTIISREPVKQDTSNEQRWSRRQPVFHVIVLGTLTFSMYIIYWLYKTLRLLKRDAQDPLLLAQHPALSMFAKISPLLRVFAIFGAALVLSIPFMAGILKLAISDAILIYIFASLIVGVALLEPDEHAFARKHPLVTCGLVLGCGLVMCGLARLEGPLYFLSLPAAALPCAFVQHWLNHYLAKTEPADVQVRTMFNSFEMVAVLVGAVFLGLVAAGVMMGIK